MTVSDAVMNAAESQINPAVVQTGAPAPLEMWRSKIEGAWKTTVASIVETGRLVKQAKEELGGSYRDLESQLPFSSSTASYLSRIAEHSVLSNAQYWSRLPNAYNTLYHLSKIESEQLIQYIEDGKVKPETTLAMVKKLTQPSQSHEGNETPTEQGMSRIVLSVPSPEDPEKFLNDIKKVIEQYNGRLDEALNKTSVGIWHRENVLAEAERQIEATKDQLQGSTLEQLRLLERALGQMPKKAKGATDPACLPEGYPDLEALADLLGTQQISKEVIKKWCRNNKVPSQLALKEVTHVVYVWEQLRLVASEKKAKEGREAKAALKRLKTLATDSMDQEVRKAARLALDSADSLTQ